MLISRLRFLLCVHLASFRYIRLISGLRLLGAFEVCENNHCIGRVKHRPPMGGDILTLRRTNKRNLERDLHFLCPGKFRISPGSSPKPDILRRLVVF
jgi:hypothetical protein